MNFPDMGGTEKTAL